MSKAEPENWRYEVFGLEKPKRPNTWIIDKLAITQEDWNRALAELKKEEP